MRSAPSKQTTGNVGASFPLAGSDARGVSITTPTLPLSGLVESLDDDELQVLADAIAREQKGRRVQSAGRVVRRFAKEKWPTIAAQVRELVERSHDGSVNAAANDIGIPQRTLLRLASGEVTSPRREACTAIYNYYGVRLYDWSRRTKARR